MNKFTIFTIILSVSVIIVIADLALRDYFSQNSQTSVINEEISPVIADTEDQHKSAADKISVAPDIESAAPAVAPASVASVSSASVSSAPASVVPASSVTPAIISEAGFNGTFVEQQFNGKVFQLLDITKIPVDGISFYEISQDGVSIASITEIMLRDEIRALQLYVLLQNKTKPYIDLSLNETNAYGDRSFYVNHAKKPEEAFLTVKIGSRIYAFAYVKYFHPQLKKLVKILSDVVGN